MKVNIKDSVYQMSTKQYKQVLKIASDAVPFGIYAINKGQVAILLDEKYNASEELQDAVKKYIEKGFIVHSNEQRVN